MVLSAWKEKVTQYLSLFKESAADVVGLDIEPDSVKLLKINSANSKYQVENFSIVPLPPGTILREDIKEPDALVSSLKTLFKQSDCQIKNVVFAIPRISVQVKSFMVDSRLNPDEIESRVWIEANNLFPELGGNQYLDYAVLGRSTEDPTHLELLVVACRKELINSYLEVLKQAGLDARSVEVNCYALGRALPLVMTNSSSTGAVALLNLNLSLSTLIVMHDHKLIHAHDQSYDGQRLITQVQNYLRDKKENPIPQPIENVAAQVQSAAEAPATEAATPTSAEQLWLDDKRYTDILKENLISQLRHLLHYFYSSHPNLPIQQMALAGDCAKVPELPAFIKKELSIETILAEPFTNMTITSHVNAEELKQHGPALMLCCGLALSGTNT